MCAYHPRIEADGVVNLTTTRTCNSELWFVNNPELEDEILARLAKCLERHEVELYAFALEGSHKHELPVFTGGRRAAFFRDFNSDVVYAVKRHCPAYTGCRKLWERRYSNEFVPDEKSIENEFFYLALQPVQDGLVERIGDYPGYNFFNDAISGRERKLKLFDYARYNSDRRWKKDIRKRDYERVYSLKYKRLPGYEQLSQKAYKKKMLAELERRRVEIVRKRYEEGKGFVGGKKLRETRSGQQARNPKQSTRYSFRPRVLSVCAETRERFLEWYFGCLRAYWEASELYRNGAEEKVEFPDGMYRPPGFTRCYTCWRDDLASI